MSTISIMPVVTATVQHTHTLTTRTDAFKTIAELAAGIFELIAFLAKDVPVAITNFAVGISHTIGMLTIMSLVKRATSFICPNSEGKMLWERDTVTEGVLNVAGTTGLTLFNISTFARYLSGAGVITLGKIAAPLGVAGGIGLGFAASMDICDKISLLTKLPENKASLIRLRDYYTVKPAGDAKEAASIDPALAYAVGRINNLNSRLNELENNNQADSKIYSEILSRFNKWSAFKELNPHDRKAIWITFNASKVEKTEAKLAAHANTQKRAIVELTFDITVIALVALSFVLPATVANLVALSVIILGVANSVLELSTNVLEFCFPEIKPPHVKVPVFVPVAPRPAAA